MVKKSKKIQSEMSVGELFDKISILEIKLDKIKDENSKKEVSKEYHILKKTLNSNIDLNEKINSMFNELKKINSNLWIIEDKLRVCEKNKDYSKDFIELARGVYLNNDKRAKIKSEINELLGSNIKEIKQYVDY